MLEGSVVVGAQEHFYMEPQVSVVQPQENDELIIHASTQVLIKAQAGSLICHTGQAAKQSTVGKRSKNLQAQQESGILNIHTRDWS